VFNSANTPELQSNRILSWFVAQAARLWMCLEFGLWRGFRRVVSKFGAEDGLPAGAVKEFSSGPTDSFWGAHGGRPNYFQVTSACVDICSTFENLVTFGHRELNSFASAHVE
jgi:hypothetical protein